MCLINLLIYCALKLGQIVKILNKKRLVKSKRQEKLVILFFLQLLSQYANKRTAMR